jgi:hypothetical protein
MAPGVARADVALNPVWSGSAANSNGASCSFSIYAGTNQLRSQTPLGAIGTGAWITCSSAMTEIYEDTGASDRETVFSALPNTARTTTTCQGTPSCAKMVSASVLQDHRFGVYGSVNIVAGSGMWTSYPGQCDLAFGGNYLRCPLGYVAEIKSQ